MQPSSPAHPALELLRERARALCDALVGRSAAGSVRAVFVGGSVGRGEVWAARLDGEWEIYSDIDLYVVVRGTGALAAVRGQARALGAIVPEQPAGARFLRGAEIGVYTLEDLLAQPLRPGTARLASESWWLFGDREVLALLARAQPTAMAREEALYLLENRIAEMAAAGPAADGPAHRLAHAMALKARLDVGSAHLIAHGAYTTSVAGRMEALRARAPDTVSPAVLADVEAAYAGYRDLDAYLASARARAPLDRVQLSAAGAWRLLAERILGAGNAAELLRRRCAQGRRRENYREFVRIARTAGMPWVRGVVHGVFAASFSARAALRAHALAVALRAREPETASQFGDFERYVDRLTRVLGFDGGPIERRVASARQAVS